MNFIQKKCNGPAKSGVLTSESKIIVDFPFVLFIYLADEDDAITVEAIECFERLLKKREWCRSDLLKKALAHTEKRRDGLWSDYVERRFTPSLPYLKSRISDILLAVDFEARDEITADFLFLLRKIAQVSRAARNMPQDEWKKEDDCAELVRLILQPERRSPGKPSQAPGAETAQRNSIDFRHLVTLGPRDDPADSVKPTHLQCVQVIDETHDVKTFCFLTNPAMHLTYLPGQFITLTLNIAGKDVHRSYTVSSAPSRPFAICITVKRVPGGLVSNWLHDNLSVDDTLAFKGPSGHFSCADDATGRLLLISGGSGITPMMSMLRWLYDWADKRPVTFLHCARTEDDLIFYDEIKAISESAPNVRLAFICGQTTGRSDRSIRQGMINLEAISEICPDYRQRAVYVCGPAPFMEATKTGLETGGFPMDQYYQESFGGAPPPERQSAPPAAASGPVTVHFADGGQTVSSTGQDTILEIAEGAGVEIPSACRAGMCGSCKIKLMKGQVKQNCTDGLSDEEKASGFVLGCQAVPQSNVEVSVDVS